MGGNATQLTPTWLQALSLFLNVAQTVALAYVTARWRSLNGQIDEIRDLHADVRQLTRGQ